MKLIARIRLDKLLTTEQFNQFTEAERTHSAAMLMVTQAFNASAEGSVINKSGQEPPTVHIEGHTLHVTYKPLFKAVELEVAELTEFDKGNKLFIPESVLNTLLHGKLLSDEEKRDLLVRQNYIKEAAK